MQKKSHRPHSESEADEETSSRDSSRKPPQHRLPQPPLSSKASKLNLDPRVVLNKRDVRSLSRDSSGSGSTTNSTSRPSRRTKEAASVYLNVLGHKLLKKRSENDEDGDEDDDDDEDNISIDSLSEATQEKRLEELRGAKKKKAAAKAANEDAASCTTDSEKEKGGSDKKKASKERKKMKMSGMCSLKQLQDKLLEEAKMKISTPPPPATVAKAKSTEQGGHSSVLPKQVLRTATPVHPSSYHWLSGGLHLTSAFHICILYICDDTDD